MVLNGTVKHTHSEVSTNLFRYKIFLANNFLVFSFKF